MSRTLRTMWLTPRGVIACLGAVGTCVSRVVAIVTSSMSRVRRRSAGRCSGAASLRYGILRVPRRSSATAAVPSARPGAGGLEPAFRSPEHYHAALHRAAAHGLETLVDLVQCPGAADQLVDLEPAF